ncbi:uncharacterized protein F5891DRAFT_189851 [Suillus fuscotomentosus]|uniref:Uncharacterized protein n=1 Tax=Suillus fuscotomentosus TaxID=1912939 RepID=A0AAD4E8W1_9AGAM|nr:uncharacterized protein F5891DRAFT_189851 [Suillus fuscotomentosus]KAG1901883.1 hypothetical protein F5891DRAFT_189851 [Suillus fuscotomentosus]
MMRIAFVISRYLPIGTVAMYLYYGVGSTHGETPNSGTYMVVIGTMNALGAAAADVMLAARVHAFCGREKRTLIAISFFSIVMVSATLIIFYVAASKCGKSTCDASEAKQFLGILYIIPMTYQLVLMALTVHKRFKFYRQAKHPSGFCCISGWYDLHAMHCPGLYSELCGHYKLPSPYSNIFYSPQVVVYSVFASRIMFNLRATHESQDVPITGPSHLERGHCSTDSKHLPVWIV